jgi:hypothetical protein
MPTVAAVIFAIAAVGGLFMAYIHFAKNRNPPVAVAVIHGAAGATALLILAYFVYTMGATPLLAWSLGLFVVAALGGFFVASFHLRNMRLPSAGVVIHALVAVVAFLLLLYAIYTGMAAPMAS